MFRRAGLTIRYTKELLSTGFRIDEEERRRLEELRTLFDNPNAVTNRVANNPAANRRFLADTRKQQALQKKIEEENLEHELSEAVSYTSNLKTKIKRILEVMGMTFYRATDIVSYAFLLPLLTELNKLINLDVQSINYEMISKAILSATGIMLSGLVIKRMVNKFLK